MIANGGLIWGSAATTLEYALADFAVDRYAGALGQPTRTAMLRASAGNWKNLFNPQTGYIEPRLASGLFTTRSEEHTSELQSLMRISYAVFCLKKKNTHNHANNNNAPLLTTHN